MYVEKKKSKHVRIAATCSAHIEITSLVVHASELAEKQSDLDRGLFFSHFFSEAAEMMWHPSSDELSSV